MQGTAADQAARRVLGDDELLHGLVVADQLLGEIEFDARYAVWEQIQEKIYTEIPAVKIGDASLASYYSERLGGWTPIIQRGIPYWNVSIAYVAEGVRTLGAVYDPPHDELYHARLGRGAAACTTRQPDPMSA